MKERIDVTTIPLVDYAKNDLDDFFDRQDIENRILLINDAITEDIVYYQTMHILRWNAEDRYLPEDKRRPITIYINSNGGSQIDGQALIDVIRTSKTTVRTVCLGMAASMAFLIYIAGHDRYAFPNACLLMHEGEQSVTNSVSKTRDVMQFFDEMDERVKNYILEMTDIDKEFYESVYKKEFWMYAEKAKELGVVDQIIGQDCDINVLFD